MKAQEHEVSTMRSGSKPAGPAGDVREYNRAAWDRQVARGNRWTVPVTSEAIARARAGEWEIVLTPARPVPRAWFGELRGREVLCLASGGGQQGPILAAAGARVTVYDNSPRQLEQDRSVAARDGLEIATIEGDMRDLAAFPDLRFDLIFHPCSNSFVPEIAPVWRESFRVLRPGGALLAGFTNPLVYLFDDALAQQGELRVRHVLPYADETHLTAAELAAVRAADEPFCFSHSLEQQIGGQLEAGFVLAGLYEDLAPEHPLNRYLPAYVATRAVKP